MNYLQKRYKMLVRQKGDDPNNDLTLLERIEVHNLIDELGMDRPCFECGELNCEDYACLPNVEPGPIHPSILELLNGSDDDDEDL